MSNFKEISKNIQRVVLDNPRTPKNKLTWININNAEKKELEYLRKNYNFELDHLKVSSSRIISQRPKIESGNDYVFLIMHFPVSQNGNITSSEIDFFIRDGELITLHDNKITALNNFFNLSKKDGQSFIAYRSESSAILLYELLKKLITECYKILDKNSEDILNIEDTIFSLEHKNAVSEILDMRRNVINFRKIVQNHKNTLKKLIELENNIIPNEDTERYYDELIEHSERIWETLDNQKEMIDVFNDTNESLINYRLNDIMKTLTIFSVIVFPLTLLAAIFGMNTMGGMPFAHNDNGFWIVIGVMLIGSLGMLIFFKRKRWI